MSVPDARRGRVGELLPAGVLHRDQRLAGPRGEGDLDVARALGAVAGMPAERQHVRRLPPGDGSPHGDLPDGRTLDDLPVLGLEQIGAIAVQNARSAAGDRGRMQLRQPMARRFHAENLDRGIIEEGVE